MTPTYKAIADHALLVTFADEIGDTAHAQVLALDRALAAAPPAGMIEAVPALVNLLVSFDPVQTDHAHMQVAVQALLGDLDVQQSAGIRRTVQVCYEGPFAPDLDAVAQATGLSVDAVINAHLGGDYHVLMYGFSPGYAYMGGVAAPIQVPRKTAAVRDVPAGSVIIAGPQCLITTLKMPTGWSIIGRSPTRVLTGDPAHPFLFDVGDTVAFERIDVATYERAQKEHADA